MPQDSDSALAPSSFKLLKHSAARLREAGVAERAVVGEHLSPRRFDGVAHGGCRLAGDALVTLAMVVGADVEINMVLAVVPTHQLSFCACAWVVGRFFGCKLLVFLYLCQEPAAGNHGMRFQQFKRGGGAHFRRNDAEQIFLDGKDVDGRKLVAFHDDAQRATKRLVLLALPVEIDTDGHVDKFKTAVLGIAGRKLHAVVKRAAPQHFSIAEGGFLCAFHGLTAEAVGCREDKPYRRAAHNAHFHLWL